MKRISLLFLGLLIMGLSFGKGFGPSPYRIGGSLYYATEIKSVGLGLNGSYKINDAFEVSATASYVLKNDNVWWAVADVEGHYIVYEYARDFNVYALGGVSARYWNYNKPAELVPGRYVYNSSAGQEEWLDEYTRPEEKDSGVNVGVTLGAGVNYPLSSTLNFVPEFKFTVQEDSYIRIVLTLQHTF